MPSDSHFLISAMTFGVHVARRLLLICYLLSMTVPENNDPRLLLRRISPELPDTLWALIKQAQAAYPLAPVTVIGPTRYANLALRQRLGRYGFVNVRFYVVSQLSELLGSGALIGDPENSPRPLTRVLEAVAVRKVLGSGPDQLQAVRSHPATQARVRSSFRRLRLAEENVLSELERRGGLPAGMVGMYRTFRADTENRFYDSHDLSEVAANAVRSDHAPALDDLGVIIFYLPGRIETPELGLIQALAEKGRCTFLLGSTGDETADRSVDDLQSSLSLTLGPPVQVDHSQVALLPGKASIHVAPTAREEVRRVLRGIMQEARENNTPFHRMAVLYRTREPYAALIPHEMSLANVPVAGPGPGLLRDTVPGRTLKGLLELAGGEFSRAEVMAWLTGCPVRLPANASPSAWDSLSRRAGIVGGLEQWQTRLEGYAKSQNERADNSSSGDEILESRARLLRNDALKATELRVFTQELGQRLVPPVDGSTWGTFSNWALNLFDNYLDKTSLDDDDSILDKVRSHLIELKAADTLSRSVTLSEFRQAVNDALQDSVGRIGATGQGVFVSSLAEAQGMTFDIIWIVGMIEGVVPPPMQPDPLLPEAEWVAAGAPSRIEQHAADERRTYLSAINSSPRRILSYPVAGASSGRKAYPSRWLLEQASALEGAPVRSGDLAGLGSRPWLTADASPRQAVTNVAGDFGLADPFDYSLHRYLDWVTEGQMLRNHPLALGTPLPKASELRDRRSHSTLTEFDGNLSTVALGAYFSQPMDRTPISPTRLETWARCPFSYFLGHVLHLSALDTPEDVLSISPLERGGLMHRILERFISESDSFPLAMTPWSAADSARMHRIAEEEFTAAEHRGVTGKALLWEMEREEILTDLAAFMEKDSALRALNGSTDVRVERKFEVADPQNEMTLRGIIDRIDLSHVGESVLVIDYKSGSSGGYSDLNKDPIDSGKRLQLAVYSLAARQLYPNAKNIVAQYWFPTSKGEFKLLPKEPFNLDDPDTLDRYNEGVTTITQGIRGGLFPANPGTYGLSNYTNCSYCDFDPICPSRRADAWERKKTDPSLASYLDLAEGELAEKEED